MKQHSHKCRKKVKKKILIQGKLSKWRTPKFWEKKFVENNPKFFSEQGIIHVNVVWQYPTQMQNRVQGPPQQHVIPNHREKKFRINSLQKQKKIPQNVGKKKSQKIFSIDQIYITVCAQQKD